jgi:copper(I)-binding protein
MTITNKGTAPDRLTCVSAVGAAQCQAHAMMMEQGVMKMRPLADGLEIKPGETVELKPSGLHMMFTGLKQPLVQGKSIKVTLKFEHAGTVDVDYAIQPIGATSATGSPPSGSGMDGMKGMKM